MTSGHADVDHEKRPHQTTARLLGEEAEPWGFVVEAEGCGETGSQPGEHECVGEAAAEYAMFNNEDHGLYF